MTGLSRAISIKDPRSRVDREQDDREQLIDEALSDALLRSLAVVSEEERAALRARLEKDVARKVRTEVGPSRAQRRYLKQIRAGHLKGSHVTDAARAAAIGIVPPGEFAVIEQPGEVLR